MIRSTLHSQSSQLRSCSARLFAKKPMASGQSAASNLPDQTPLSSSSGSTGFKTLSDLFEVSKSSNSLKRTAVGVAVLGGSLVVCVGVIYKITRDMRDAHDALRADFRANSDMLRDELKAELKAEVKALRDDLKADIEIIGKGLKRETREFRINFKRFR